MTTQMQCNNEGVSEATAGQFCNFFMTYLGFTWYHNLVTWFCYNSHILAHVPSVFPLSKMEDIPQCMPMDSIGFLPMSIGIWKS